METEPKNAKTVSEIADEIAKKYELSDKEEVLFLRAVLDLGGTGADENWEETLQDLNLNPRVKDALKEFAAKTD